MVKKHTTNHMLPTTLLHSIRLRHPWQCQTDGGQAAWTRKFNWPAELSADEMVQLVIEPAHASASISLNGEPITTESDGRIDITTLIAKHNLLTITSATLSPAESQQCPFDVRLDISAD